MRRILIGVLALALLLPCVASAEQVLDVDPKKYINDEDGPIGYVPNRFIIVLKEGVAVDHAKDARTAIALSDKAGFAELAQRHSVAKIRPQFVGSDVAKHGQSDQRRQLARHYKVYLEGENLDAALEAYRAHPMVERVEKIGIHLLYATPNDTYYDNPPPDYPHDQWHYWDTYGIEADQAWDSEAGDQTVIVGDLDIGTKYDHGDLGGSNPPGPNDASTNGNIWINSNETPGNGVDDDGNGYVDDILGWDFVERTDWYSYSCIDLDCGGADNDPSDGDGHGTHTAGTIAAITNNGYCVAGVAGGFGNGSYSGGGNGVKIVPCRIGYVLDYWIYGATGVVIMDYVAEAMYYMGDLKASGWNVASINCSFGSSNSGGLGAAADYLISQDVVICVAAGNSNSSSADYLSSRGDCLDVGATDQNGDPASFSNYGSWVDIAAPGVEVMSTMTDPSDPSGDYVAYMDGTSMACPHVAGVVALLESVNPSLSATDKINIITDPANVKSYNQTKDVGVGIVDAYKCLQAAGGGCDLAADFSGSPTSGCASLAVSFTDLSTGSGIDGWSWDFGDGGSSTSQNPSHTYSNPGTYTVSLTVSSSSQGCNDTRTRNSYITVDGGPTAGFVGSPTSGTEPLTVDFTNQSSNATSYSWDFGDGGSSTATNPSHTYDAAGTYTVSLTATNACGSDVETKTDYITVNPCVAPVADFSGSPTSGDAPLTVDFTDLSSDATSWSWDFGDGGSSTAQNPSHTYDAAGTYTVSLTATNGCGSDGETKTDYITVTEPTVDYATLPYSTGFESGSFDQYWFTQSSNSEGRILVTTANSPRGSYHVTMDDNTNGSQYAQNEAWLRLNLSGGGDVDLTFYWKEFSDESHTQDGVFFSDDGGSTFTKVYDLTGGSSTYQQIVLDVDQLAGNAGLSLTSTFVVKFQQYDNYSITTDGHAIDDISVESTTLPAPVADFTGSPTSGDAPLEVSFTDQSTNSPTSWSWDFGDGGSSTVQNPTYTYSSAGTYTVSLTATNASGSDTETKTDYITVTDPPVSQVVGEVGEIVRNQGGGGADWYSVTLNNTYSNPVVVMRGLSFNGGHPTHLRVRNVGTGSFEWQMEEWDYKDGNHTTENCPYMVVEAGVHTLEDGTIIQAGTVSASTSWVTVNFSSSFTSTPTLLTGVASDNDPAACITRTRNLGTGSFQIKVQEEEAADGVHSSETVAWIAIEQGTGTNNSVAFEAGRTGNEVTDAWYTINYTQSFGATPIVLCHDDTYDGGNTCGTRFRNNSTTSVEVFIEEEQSNDSETGHITEVVSWVAWGAAGDILSQSQVASIGKEDAVEMASTDNGLPSRYSLDQNYPNPFNPVTTIEFSLAQPGHAKLEVFNIAGQKVTTLVDQYLSSGEHVATWDGSNVSSGVYFYRLTTERRADTRKMILLK